MRVGGSILQNTHRQTWELHCSVCLFLVAINGILYELVNGVDGSFFIDDLAIHITTRNQRVAFRALQGATNKLDAWLAERSLTFSPSKTVRFTFRKRGKRNKEPLEIMLRSRIIPSKESIFLMRFFQAFLNLGVPR